MLSAVIEYRKLLSVMQKWLLTPEVEETVYRTSITADAERTKGFANVHPLHDSLAQSLAFANLLAESEAVLRFVTTTTYQSAFLYYSAYATHIRLERSRTARAIPTVL